MRTVGDIVLLIGKNGDIILSSREWIANTTEFMTFASKIDPKWANEQHQNSPHHIWSESNERAHSGSYKIRKRKGKYWFSFGFSKTDYSRQEYIDNNKTDWPEVIGCNRIIVHRVKHRIVTTVVEEFDDE